MLFLCNTLYSQKMEVFYKVKFIPQKGNIKERIEYSHLKINKFESYYLPARKMNDSLRIEEIFLNFTIYQSNSRIKYYGTFNDLKFYFEEKANSKWAIIPNSTSTYKNYKTLQAKIKLDGRDWIATFAPDIPISSGPYKFQGLPGLIINVYSEDKEYSFEMVGLLNTKKETTLKFTNYKKMKKSQIEKYIADFFVNPASNNIFFKNSYGDTFDYKYQGKKDESYYSTNSYILDLHRKYNNPIDKTTFILVY